MLPLLQRLFILIFTLQSTLMGALQSPPVKQDPSIQPRLEVITNDSGAFSAITSDTNRLWVGQGKSIIQLNADLQIENRATLNYGQIIDLRYEPQALYALTESHLLVLNTQDFSLLQVIAGSGKSIIRTDNTLNTLTSSGVLRRYAVAANGTLSLITQSKSTEIDAISADSQGRLIVGKQDTALSFFEANADIDTTALTAIDGLRDVNNILTRGIYTYATNRHYLNIIDTQNIQRPSVTGVYAPLSHFRDVAWQGGRMAMADGRDGLTIYDAPNLNQPPRYIAGQRGTPAIHVEWQNNVVMSTHRDSIRFYDSSFFPNLNPQVTIPLWDTPSALTVIPQSSIALVGVSSGGIAVIDYSQGANAQLVGSLVFSGSVTDIALHPAQNGIIFVTLDDGRLLTLQFNRFNPSQSVVLDDLPIAGRPEQIAINAQASIMAVASNRSGTHFLTLTDTIPSYEFTHQAETRATQVQAISQNSWAVIDGNIMKLIRTNQMQSALETDRQLINDESAPFLTKINNRVVLGVSNQMTFFTDSRQQFSQLMNYVAPTTYQDMLIADNYLLLMSNEPTSQITILNIGNPNAPREQATYQVPFHIDNWHLLIGNQLMLLNQQLGVAVVTLDLSAAQSGMLTINNRYPQQPKDGNTQLILDENYHLQRLSADGERLADNRDIFVSSFVEQDDTTLWIIDIQRQLLALDAQSLTPRTDIPMTPLGVEPTTLSLNGNNLWMGTSDGRIIALRLPSANTSAQVLFDRDISEGAILDLRLIDSGLLLTTDDYQVIWLDTRGETLEVIASYQANDRIEAIALSGNQNWLAVADGNCGLVMLDARQRDLGLRVFGNIADGVATSVSFIDDRTVSATINGVEQQVIIHPDGRQATLEQPSSPFPPDQIGVSVPVTELRWQMDGIGCQAMQYEIFIEGRSVGVSDTATFALPAPLYLDTEWYVVATDADNNRVQSPTWQIYTEAGGWINEPLPLNQQIADMRQPDDTVTWYWYLLGIMALLMIALGGWVGRSQRR